eukprot:jgi/Mesvir1/11378/Mv10278-RA.1
MAESDKRFALWEALEELREKRMAESPETNDKEFERIRLESAEAEEAVKRLVAKSNWRLARRGALEELREKRRVESPETSDREALAESESIIRPRGEDDQKIPSDKEYERIRLESAEAENNPQAATNDRRNVENQIASDADIRKTREGDVEGAVGRDMKASIDAIVKSVEKLSNNQAGDDKIEPVNETEYQADKAILTQRANETLADVAASQEAVKRLMAKSNWRFARYGVLKDLREKRRVESSETDDGAASAEIEAADRLVDEAAARRREEETVRDLPELSSLDGGAERRARTRRKRVGPFERMSGVARGGLAIGQAPTADAARMAAEVEMWKSRLPEFETLGWDAERVENTMKNGIAPQQALDMARLELMQREAAEFAAAEARRAAEVEMWKSRLPEFETLGWDAERVENTMKNGIMLEHALEIARQEKTRYARKRQGGSAEPRTIQELFDEIYNRDGGGVPYLIMSPIPTQSTIGAYDGVMSKSARSLNNLFKRARVKWVDPWQTSKGEDSTPKVDSFDRSPWPTA